MEGVTLGMSHPRGRLVIADVSTVLRDCSDPEHLCFVNKFERCFWDTGKEETADRNISAVVMPLLTHPPAYGIAHIPGHF